MIDEFDVIQQFSDAMQARGLIPPHPLEADGQLHRCDVEGHNGKDDGSYLLHLDKWPAGGFQNFRDGLGWENWRYDRNDLSWPPRLQPVKGRAAASAARDAVKDMHAEAAQKRAEGLWAKRRPANPNHAYLAAKGVKPFGIGQLGGALMVPVRTPDGTLQSLQFIQGDGQKRFLKGGRIKGCCHVIGTIGDDEEEIAIAEGYATAASIHMATQIPVVVAFDCGNLCNVAVGLHHKFPHLKLTIAADDDDQTPGNPGLTKAFDAARRVGAVVAVPGKKVA